MMLLALQPLGVTLQPRSPARGYPDGHVAQGDPLETSHREALTQIICRTSGIPKSGLLPQCMKQTHPPVQILKRCAFGWWGDVLYQVK